ncbi:MAG: NAD(P)-binding protein [Candidatus Lokiarchaeota archaeon]|nr:NAD(P)-binding protein [Candidatus Lokiarchaeota archaeon]
MQKKDSSPHYDAVIIGGGIAGLIVGNILTYNGLKSIIVEKNYKTGGYVTNFTRGDYRFDAVIHFINGCGSGGMVNQILKSFKGENVVDWLKLKEIFHWVDVDNKYELHVPISLEEQVETLVKEFPHEEHGIRKFYARYSKVVIWLMSWFTKGFFGKVWLWLSKFPTFVRFITHVGKPIKNIIDPYISDPILKEMMTALCISFGMFRDEMSAMTWLMSEMSYRLEGAWYPIGGGGKLSKGLNDLFLERGGKVILNAKVTELIVENKQAIGIRYVKKNKDYKKDKNTKITREIFGNYIINDIDLTNFVNNIAPKNTFSDKFVQKINNKDTTDSSVVVFIGLDFDVKDYGINDYELWRFYKSNATKANLEYIHHSMDYQNLPIEMITFYSNGDTTCCPKGKTCLSMIYYAHTEDWKVHLENGKRGKHYKELKKKVADQFVDILSNAIKIPDLKSHIEVIEVSTPLTLQRYCETKNGAHMGFRMTPELSMLEPVGNQSPIRNLIFTGQWCRPGGGVSASMLGGLSAAELILKKHSRN